MYLLFILGATDMEKSSVSNELSKLGSNLAKVNFLIVIAIEFDIEGESKPSKLFIYKKSSAWKAQVKTICNNAVKFYWLRKPTNSVKDIEDNDPAENVEEVIIHNLPENDEKLTITNPAEDLEIIPIFLYKEDAANVIKRKNSKFEFPDGFLQGQDENNYVFTIVNNQVKAVNIDLFMNFWSSKPHIIKILPMSDVNFSKDFRQYIEIAKYHDLNECVFKKIYTEIYKITENFYSIEINPSTPIVYSYASIVGPSLMGKTQFAFSLARVSPVFYVNFAPPELMQNIYGAFYNISSAFTNCLFHDVDALRSLNLSLDSDCLILLARDTKLETIGLLWEFVMYSTEFEFDGTIEWFEYYVGARQVNFEKMSVYDYLQNLSKRTCEYLFLYLLYISLIRTSYNRFKC